MTVLAGPGREEHWPDQPAQPAGRWEGASALPLREVRGGEASGYVPLRITDPLAAQVPPHPSPGVLGRAVLMCQGAHRAVVAIGAAARGGAGLNKVGELGLSAPQADHQERMALARTTLPSPTTHWMPNPWSSSAWLALPFTCT